MSTRKVLSGLFRDSSRDVSQRLLRDLAVILVVTVGAMTAATLLMGVRLKQDRAVGHIENTIVVVRQELQHMFSPVTQLLEMTRRWGMAGELQSDKAAALNRRFIPALETLPQIEGLVLARSDGREYFLLREERGWLTREREPPGGEVLWRLWDDTGEVREQWRQRSDYDPLSRPWYSGALAPGQDGKVYWTKPYVFYTRKAPGITAAVSYSSGPNAEKNYVLAFDVLLANVAAKLADFPVGERGRAFLLSSDGGVVLPQSSASDEFADSGEYTSLFAPGRYPDGDLLFDAAQRWQQLGKMQDEPIRFTSAGTAWWGGFVPIYQDSDVLWLGVVVPESDLLGILYRHWAFILLLGLLVLATGILLVVLVAAKYRRLMKNIPKTSIDKSDFGNEIHALVRCGENANLEFKSTLRMNLKTGKSGKEIELAWLKTLVAFLNTQGGILLIGVSDDGEVLGLEADGFENEDRLRLHFKNLLNQHVGLEFSQYVQLDVQPVEGKLVAAIECERSPEPVFLHAKSDESFYIRSGPASVKLGISKALKYIQEY